MTTVCCQCHRAQKGKSWRRKLVRPEQSISHGYCPKCYQKLLQKIIDYFPDHATALPVS